jgi:hypothetical protein
MSLDSSQRSREALLRTASAVWRFGEETLVSDPFSGGAFIAPPFSFLSSVFPYQAFASIGRSLSRRICQPFASGIGAAGRLCPEKSRGGKFPRRPVISAFRSSVVCGSPGVRMGCQGELLEKQ